MGNLMHRIRAIEPTKDEKAKGVIAKAELPPGTTVTPEIVEAIMFPPTASVPEITITLPRGRPKTGNAKVPVTIRLDRDVLETLEKLGPEWRAEANQLLRQALSL